MGVLRTYPYFFANVLWLSALLPALRLLPSAGHRRLVIRLGLALVPSCLFSPFLFSDYWDQVRIGGWALGVEDVLCSFNLGATGCLIVIFLFRHDLVFADQPQPALKRFLMWFLWGHGAFFLLWTTSGSSIASLILTQSLAAISLLLLRRDLWRISLVNGVAFPLFYCALLKTFFSIWPDFVSCWRSTTPWGQLVCGLPLGEIVYAISLGLVWPLFAGFVFGFRLKPLAWQRASLVTQRGSGSEPRAAVCR
jgi:hypothetical protein